MSGTTTTTGSSRSSPQHLLGQQQGGVGETTTLWQIDNEFEQRGCLGHGTFGSVFLARKRSSGRQVALKFMRFELDDGDSDEEEQQQQHKDYLRELDSMLKLDNNSFSSSSSSEEARNRHLSIVFVQDWFRGPGFACFVMNYADGGTLAQEIQSKQSGNPYSERRIAWYALQLSEALAYAHERGVVHHDVKSSNVLIDRADGGKLLLADFGSAIAPGEESVGFSEIYASPELQAAHNRDDFASLVVSNKIDSFGLGCILFETLCCKRLVDLTVEQTLAEFIESNSVDAALDLSCVRLPWLPETNHDATTLVGYSRALWRLVKALLHPIPSDRWAPSQLERPLRYDPRSPLLVDNVSAAEIPIPGSPVTIDNVQIGMFVQRGLHWDDSNGDGAVPGAIGVVVKLDADGGYTEVAFPPQQAKPSPANPLCCRIGARKKYELQIGPTPIVGRYKTMLNGIVSVENMNMNFSVGQVINDNCMVVGTSPQNPKLLLVVPLEPKIVPTLPLALPPVPVGPMNKRKPMTPPDSWNVDRGVLVEVLDADERQRVWGRFFSFRGGFDSETHSIQSIKRVQSLTLWEKYAISCEQVAEENWGILNEHRLFHGTGRHTSMPELVCTPRKYQEMFSSRELGLMVSESPVSVGRTCFNQTRSGESNENVVQMILARVSLGRVDESNNAQTRPQQLKYHSVRKPFPRPSYRLQNPFQAFPEYVVTFTTNSSRLRVVRPTRPQTRPGPPGFGLRISIPRDPWDGDQNLGGQERNTTRTRRGLEPPEQGRRSSANDTRRSRQNRIGTTTGTPQFSRRNTFAAQATEERAQERHSRRSARTNSSSGLSDAAPWAALASSSRGSPATSRNDANASSSHTSSKMCVICWEHPVSHILIPCGHPCLCQNCAMPRRLRRLRNKCPECRTPFREVVKFYGRLVED